MQKYRVSDKRKCKHCRGIKFRPAISFFHNSKVVIFICDYCSAQQYELLPSYIPEEQLERFIDAKV